MLVETKIDFWVLIALIFHIDLIKRFKQFMNSFTSCHLLDIMGVAENFNQKIIEFAEIVMIRISAYQEKEQIDFP